MTIGSSWTDGALYDSARLARRETFRKLEVRLVWERLGRMLEEVGGAMAAQRRLDAHPDAPDIRDIDVLVTFVERDWAGLDRRLAKIPRMEWPPGASEIDKAVTGVSETLYRPLA
jgi:hypothetical protein